MIEPALTCDEAAQDTTWCRQYHRQIWPTMSYHRAWNGRYVGSQSYVVLILGAVDGLADLISSHSRSTRGK